MSMPNKVWVGLVKLLKGKHPLLYSFQAALPKLPVPGLSSTKKRVRACGQVWLQAYAYGLRLVYLLRLLIGLSCGPLLSTVVLKRWEGLIVWCLHSIQIVVRLKFQDFDYIMLLVWTHSPELCLVGSGYGSVCLPVCWLNSKQRELDSSMQAVKLRKRIFLDSVAISAFDIPISFKPVITKLLLRQYNYGSLRFTPKPACPQATSSYINLLKATCLQSSGNTQNPGSKKDYLLPTMFFQ